MSRLDPPPGWFVFGTHAYHGAPEVEFSAEVDEEDLLPLWERPLGTGSGCPDEDG